MTCTHNCETCPHRGQCGTQVPERTDENLKIANNISKFNKIIFVISNKGGVGKSTVSTQLAYALQEQFKVQTCLLDVDITGPSIPTLTKTVNAEIYNDADGWAPVQLENGLQLLSIGYMLGNCDDPVIMRGPKKHSVISQFLTDCNWNVRMKEINGEGQPAYLIIDTPPGTSDEHLSIINLIKQCNLLVEEPLRPEISAIIVTTPSELSVADVRKGVNFCKQIQLPIKGIIENMSGFVCPCCNKVQEIFNASTGGAAKLCEQDNLPLLGKIPLDRELNLAGENGIRWNSDSIGVKNFLEIVQKIIQ